MEHKQPGMKVRSSHPIFKAFEVSLGTIARTASKPEQKQAQWRDYTDTVKKRC